MGEVRVRFAPSPTGYLHVGNARTAILNWVYARHAGGRFVLRIEDTDAERSTREYEQAIYDDLRWLGLDWDEGPDVGGDFGPYRQTERLSLYKEYAEKLLAEGKAFYCYCTAEEIKAKAEKAIAEGKDPHYDGHCYHLTREQIRRYEAEGRKPVIRFRIPTEKIRFSDVVRGEIEVDSENLSDFVILRSDGVATYNYAVVLDDVLMKISHVIRGEDHLSNTPKQVLLFKALGFPLPNFVHIPMILGGDRAKLSKRHGGNSVRDFRELGYLPDALVNFLSLLGWSSPSGQEVINRQQLIDEFDFSRVSRSAVVFNLEKLNWLNGWYLRHTKLEKIVELGKQYLEKAGFDTSNHEYVARCIEAVLDRIEYLAQLPEWCSPFFADDIQFENPDLFKDDESQKMLALFLQKMELVENWSATIFLQVMKEIQKETGIKGKKLWMPIRMALTGREHGVELPKVVELLGFEKCKKFIEKALNSARA